MSRDKKSKYTLYEYFKLAAGEPVKIANKIKIQILYPKLFASLYISDTHDKYLANAFRFYLANYAVAFAILAFSTRYQYFHGVDHIRQLSQIWIQIGLAIPLLFLLTRFTTDRASFFAILQIVLYVDAIYILLVASVNLLIHYLDFITRPLGPSEVDVFSTEYERCISDRSWVYWLLTGRFEYDIFSDLWRPNNWRRWIIENFDWFLAAVLLIAYGRLANAKFKNGFWFNVIFGGLVYCIVVPSHKYIVAKIVALEVTKYPECISIAQDNIQKHYASTMIAKQITYKLNNDAIKQAANSTTPYAPTLYEFANNMIIWRWTLNFDPLPNEEKFRQQMNLAHTNDYCSTNWYWQMARRLNIPLAVGVNREGRDGWILLKRYDQNICPTKAK